MASVLIVEDNADLREMYEEILVLDGNATHLAETVSEAIAQLAAHPADVVVLDLGISGPVEALIEAIRAGGARIILASGAKGLPEHAVAMGAAGYLLKPFTPEQLVAAVASAAVR
jgi:DNA-binding NtrC family response regulator